MQIEGLRKDLIPKLSEAMELFAQPPAAEELPFDEKYKSRSILKSLQTGDLVQSLTNKKLKIFIELVLDMLLAENLMETEEITPACDKYRSVYEQYSNNSFDETDATLLADMFRIKLLNSVGFSFVTVEKVTEGLNYFLRALDIYENAKSKLSSEDSQTDSENEERQITVDILKTVLKFDNLQKLSTMTYFFMAQTYGALGDKHNSAKYCGLTLERQLIEFEKGNTTDFNEREFVLNSIGLAQYYTEECYFRQSKIILVEALKLVGNEQGVEVGNLKFLLGNLYKALFKFNSELILQNVAQVAYEKSLEHINEAFLNLNINEIKPIEQILEGTIEEKSKSPTIDETSEPFVLYNNYEELKAYFRKSLGYYKDSMVLLPLDGYVTEYCESLKGVSGLYKLATYLENNQDRILTMEKRREQLITEVLNGLNPNIFKNLCVELTAELADVETHIFEIYQQEFVKTGKGAKKLNNVGKEALSRWNSVSEYMESTDQTLQQSYINCLYNKGRIYTKMHESDKAVFKQNLIMALSIYEKVRNTIYQMKKDSKVLDKNLEDQLKVTEEFCQLLPVRISKL